MQDVFVIGDVHGNLDRLEALLKQEGLLDRCEDCDGSGLVPADCSEPYQHEYQCACPEEDCISCDGDGWERKRRDVTVVQLGDLGHFGARGSMTGDMLCYKYVAVNRWCDVVLWGNHDRAAIDGAHHATDFIQVPEARHYISMLYEEGRMQMAFYAHGFLITHAGLAAAFKGQGVDEQLKTDPEAFVDWINDEDESWLDHVADDDRFAHENVDPHALAIINAIGARRGGRVPTGGLLWRDINEKLYDGFRQIFGHSADPQHQVRYCWRNGNTRKLETHEPSEVEKGQYSYCIDVGGKGNENGASCLAGIWLPSERIVRVDL